MLRMAFSLYKEGQTGFSALTNDNRSNYNKLTS